MQTNRQTKFTSLSFITALLIILLLTSTRKTNSVLAQPEIPPLFRDAKTSGSLELSAEALRSRYVELNLTALRGMDGNLSSQSLVGNRVRLNLFPDVTYEMVIDSIGSSPSGGNAWNGHINGVELSYIYMIYTPEGVFAAHIASPQGIYEVQYAGEKLYVVNHIDQSLYANDIVLEPKIPAPLLPAVEADANSLAITSVDVMVVYTANAVTAVGGTAAMNAKIDLAMQEANQSYSNSNVNISLNLVHKAQVTYSEGNPANFNLALDRLTNKTDTYIDNVHTLRDTYKADLVTLIVESGSSGTCGIAWLMTAVSPSFESYGFNVVAQSCATGYYSFAHELGHNMGSRHDAYVDSSNTPYPYSHGFTYPAAGWRTIMAYNNACVAVGTNCTRLQYWSNPNVNYGGVAMGNSAANNAQSLNNTAATVASFRVGSGFNKSSPSNGAVNQPVTNLGVSWSTSTGATQYEVCYDTSNDNACNTSWQNKGNVTSATITGLTNNTTYYWQVRAFNGSTYAYANSGTWWSFTTVGTGNNNDDFLGATQINSLPYNNPGTQNIGTATSDTTDPDFPCGGGGKKSNTVWFKYTPGSTTFSVDTIGSNYDTVLAVWVGTEGALTNVACNDDYGSLQSQVTVNGTAGVTYYIEVAAFSATAAGQLDLHVASNNVETYIGGSLTEALAVGSGQSISRSYGINNGPVHVTSTDGSNIFTSQRAIFGSSFNSIVGYPADQLTTEYWFTSYDDVGMITYLVIGNPHSSNTAQVDVYIGGNKMNATPYSIAPGQRIFPRYGINSGPVRVVSTNGVNIFTSERTKLGNSFNEVMGYPANQLTTDYWFTSYDDVGMITYLVIGNPHVSNTAQVDVYIGGVKRNATPYQIAPGQRVFLRYGINSGPVRVVSTNGVNIFASERTKFGNTFNEVMGYPGNQVHTEFWFTSYDDVGMITYLVIGNPHSSNTAQVDVYIGGVKKNATPYSIAPGQRVFLRYGINSGPVRVVSTNGVNIFASERAKYINSFNEILGIANNQLTTDYWFTAYDDVGMDTNLVIAAP
jgi:hypothetical protein